jgi:beta-lactamase regulating signal transducer with metallopeptidase domain/predicted esterase
MIRLSDLAWTQFWQVTTVAAGVALVARLCCRHRPHLAHALWLLVLIKCVTPPLWSSPTSLFSWVARESAESARNVRAPVAVELGSALEPEAPPESHRGNPERQPPFAFARDAESTPSGPSIEVGAKRGVAFPRVRLAQVLGITWLMGASAYGAYLVLATIHCWRTMRRSRIPAEERLTRAVAALSRRLGIRRAVRLWVTREPLGPLTFGWVRPTVVLPEALAAHRSTDELEPLLAHELVHVRRGDAFVGLLQAAVQGLWWFHPLIWWSNRRVAFERERCCDEEVVASLALEPGRYARSLLKVLELKRQLRGLTALPGARPFEITQRRLEHIMLRGGRFRSRMPYLYWPAMIVLALLLVPGAGLTRSSSRGASARDEPAADRLHEPAAQTKNAQPATRTPAVAVGEKEALGDAEMHFIGIYQSKRDAGAGKGRVDVEVRATAKPVVLVLTSYFSVDWHVKLADGARVKRAIVSGYFAQEIDGLPANTPIVNRSYFPEDGSRRKDGWFWAHKWNTPQWRQVVRKLNDMTGLAVSSFQGGSDGDSFIVDDHRGRNLGQNGLNLHARRKELTARELMAALVDAELHVVGIYSPDMTNPGKPVDVEVRPTPKPVVLVLTSYGEAVWNVKRSEGARIKAVVVGGYFPQEIDDIPAEIPVASSNFSSARNNDYFYAYKANTLEYRRMVERLNDLTGLLVSSFQGEYTGTSFVIDGARGRNHAQKERKPRPTLPREIKREELRAAASGAELQVVGAYSASAGNGAPVDVDVRATGKPIVLALTSYGSVLWNVKLARGAQIKAVIVGGYYEQEIEGVPAGVPIAYRAYFPSQYQGYYWGYQWNSQECRNMAARLNDETGRPISTFQGEYDATSFVVDGTRGREAAQTKARVDEPPPRDRPRSGPKPEANPLADVADIPSRELRAGGDADKRYLLIGPRKNAEPPPEGYGLVVIMPGGDGSADFLPFVKRIYKNALSNQYLAVQPIAVRWTTNQEVVWPTKTNPVARMKFGTEDFVEAVIADVAKGHKLDRSRIFSLSWSSSGPAAYAASLQQPHSIKGSFVAMSVFNPKFLPPLNAAKGHAYYLYHSEQDRICPYRMAERAKSMLSENGAHVRLETYDGGHGWRGNVYQDIRDGIEWLEKNRE